MIWLTFLLRSASLQSQQSVTNHSESVCIRSISGSQTSDMMYYKILASYTNVPTYTFLNIVLLDKREKSYRKQENVYHHNPHLPQLSTFIFSYTQ